MSERHSALLPLGILAIVLSLSSVHAAIAVPSYQVGGGRLAWELGYAALLWLAAYAVGLPETPRNWRQASGSAVAASLGGAIGISIVQLALGVALVPRFVVFGSSLLSVVWFVVAVGVCGRGLRLAEQKDRVLVVGDDEQIAQLQAELDTSAFRGPGISTMHPSEARPAAIGAAPLLSAADAVGATVIVLDRSAQADQVIVDQAAMLHERGLRVRTLSLFYEQWLQRLPVAELERVSLMFDIGEVHRARYARRKRLLDMVIGAAALPLLLVVIPFVALGNLVANRGSLFFVQERVGKGGRIIRISKFRTMTGAASGAGEWTAEDDPRITPFGRFLRRTHLDELPQLINVFRGELSIVGPRPEQPHYVDELATKLPFYEMRHLVQPGLTGWAQVHQSYASSDADALEKLQFEFWYLRHQSLAIDVRIIARTLRTIVAGVGR